MSRIKWRKDAQVFSTSKHVPFLAIACAQQSLGGNWEELEKDPKPLSSQDEAALILQPRQPLRRLRQCLGLWHLASSTPVPGGLTV